MCERKGGGLGCVWGWAWPVCELALTHVSRCCCYSSVHASWNTYFKNVDSGLLPGQVRLCCMRHRCAPACVCADTPPAVCRMQAFLAPPDLQPGVQPTGGVSDAHGADIARIVHLIRAFQVRGHEVANLDPLALTPRKELAELDYKNYVRRVTRGCRGTVPGLHACMAHRVTPCAHADRALTRATSTASSTLRAWPC